MKKNIILFLLLMSSFACAKDYQQFCSVKTPQKSFSGVMTSFSGANILARNLIENQLEKAIKKETNSKFKFKVSNFFGSNILQGEFKSLSAKSKRFVSDDLYLSNIKIETICPYNKVAFQDENLILEENIVLKFSAQMNQDDLAETINSKAYKGMIEKLNNDKTISKFVKIVDSDVKIKGDKLLFKYSLLPTSKYNIFKSKKPINIAFGANLKVMGGKVKICNFELKEKYSTYGIFLPVVNKLNPTSWNIEFDENTKGSLEFDDVKIANDKIFLEGYVLVFKNN